MPKTKKKAKIWHDCRLPAALFFEILESGKLAKLVRDEDMPTPSNRKLEKAWKSIYDEFFTLKNDPKLKLILKVKRKIMALKAKIDLAKQCIYALTTVAFTDEQLDDLVKRLKKIHIRIDTGKDLKDEILRVLRMEIPALKTSLELEISNMENLTKAEKTTFEENCVAFEGFGYKIDENVSLRKYLAYEKAVTIKSKKLEKDARR